MITKDEDKLSYNQATLKPDSEFLIRNRVCAAFGMSLEVGTQRVNSFMYVCCDVDADNCALCVSL